MVWRVYYLVGSTKTFSDRRLRGRHEDRCRIDRFVTEQLAVERRVAGPALHASAELSREFAGSLLLPA
jgi:hypothetical protein